MISTLNFEDFCVTKVDCSIEGYAISVFVKWDKHKTVNVKYTLALVIEKFIF